MGHITQGIRDINGTNTVFFILKHEVICTAEKVTYGKIVCDIKPDKFEKHRTMLKVGGNLLDCAGFMSTPTATVTTTEYLLNSIVCTLNSKCVTAGIKKFY